MANDAASTINFLQRYKEYRAETSKSALSKYTSFFDSFKIVQTAARTADEEEASEYNLFSVIKLDFSEVRLHTPIIANLLNPLGTHSQGMLFYKEFIKTCFPLAEQTIFLKASPQHLYIKDELGMHYGQMDIFLYNRQPQNKFVVIIENKVGAPDQDRQLYRYYTYASRYLGLSDDRIRIVYLKPKPSKWDELYDNADKTELERIVIPVGYDPHIKSWLGGSLRSVKASKVAFTVQQYLQTLKTITT